MRWGRCFSDKFVERFLLPREQTAWSLSYRLTWVCFYRNWRDVFSLKVSESQKDIHPHWQVALGSRNSTNVLRQAGGEGDWVHYVSVQIVFHCLLDCIYVLFKSVNPPTNFYKKIVIYIEKKNQAMYLNYCFNNRLSAMQIKFTLMSDTFFTIKRINWFFLTFL